MKIFTKLTSFYDTAIIEKPYFSLFFILSLILFFSLSIPNFKMDASADSLVFRE